MNNSLSEEQKDQIFSNLEHKLVYKRIKAVRDLVNVSDKRVIPSLIRRLSDAGRSGPECDERVCDVAVQVLEQLNSPEATKVANAWRKDQFPFFRKALDWYDDKYEIPALRELNKLDDERVIDAFMYALGGYSHNAYEIARDAIIQRGSSAIPKLIEYLNDDNGFRRKDAAYLLGRIGNPIVVNELIAASYDSEARVRCKVVEALGTLGSEDAIDCIKKRLFDKSKCDPHYTDRVCDVALKALQSIGTSEAIQAVEEWQSLTLTEDIILALQSDDNLVVREAVWTAGRLKIQESVEILLGLLDSNDDEIKRGSIWSLGVLRDPRAVNHLLQFINHDDPKIANQVKDSLQKLGHSVD
ncbi:MAG: HEAT repeat domain-containing protein [Chloroflexota bacterium]